MKPALLSLPLILAALCVAGPSPAQSTTDIPVQSADDSHVARPRAPIEPDMLGYGTRAVDGRTLGEMLAKCRLATDAMGEVEKARCDQLRRTLENQPGNAVGS